MSTNPLLELHKQGQSVWYDSLRRGLIRSGELKRMIDEDGLAGVTSNPTILDKAIAGSNDYADAVDKLLEAGATPDDIYESLVLDDIRAAADVLRPVYDATQGGDGFVSLEVSPALAHDTKGTIEQARHFHAAVSRPNLMVKVPATPEGMPAIRALIGEGININVTLIFSLDAYRQVIDAYFGGLEELAKSGQALGPVRSVASFFVSRVDTAVDKLLLAKISQEQDPAKQEVLKKLLGAAAIANSKMAYQMFKEEHAGPRFKALEAKGAHVQRVLWASTSTKNPAYRDVRYVEALVGPHTIDTMPPETVVAFRDHGQVTPGTVEQDVEGTKATLRALTAAGIDMDKVTGELLTAGVESFSQSFVKLMQCITERREGYLTGMMRRQTAQLASHQRQIDERLHALDEAGFVRRLWNQDLSLWSDDPAVQAKVKNRLGWLWLNPADDNRERLNVVRNLAREVKNAGFLDAVLLGMGGSSLAPEVFGQTFGHIDGYPRLHVLDTTDPQTILELDKSLDVARTLFIVSTKSGTTTETEAASRYFFYDKLKALKGDRAGENFVAITDANTPLARAGSKNRFRAVLVNPADIGGRFSVLSYFGLAPAAIMGLDVESLLDRAERMAHSCAPCIVSSENPGVYLGAVLAELGQKGHDKVTVLCSPQLESFGLWVEQLIAESTGKQGRGLVPVAGEAVGAPLAYDSDRLFVYLRLQSADNTAMDEQVRELVAGGHPLVTLDLSHALDLGGEFFRWEMAIAVVGALWRINPFDEPNVQESKDNTRRVLGEWEKTGRISQDTALAQDGLIEISGDNATRVRLEARIKELDLPSGVLTSFLTAHLSLATAGDYLAFMAYVPYANEIERSLQAIRTETRDVLRVATTLGYGPRFLHSTGQLHKGGPDTGVFVQITADSPVDTGPIPKMGFSFGVLISAQARGDLLSLQSHNRPTIRIHLKESAEKALPQLEAAFKGSLSFLEKIRHLV